VSDASGSIEQQVGDRIRQLRTERGWTQRELTERIGVDINISSIERGQITVRIDTLQRIADALEVAPRELLP
jgi:transcriptional regulator with XRE-family HTH domain